jgi:hypothetical protein
MGSEIASPLSSKASDAGKGEGQPCAGEEEAASAPVKRMRPRAGEEEEVEVREKPSSTSVGEEEDAGEGEEARGGLTHAVTHRRRARESGGAGEVGPSFSPTDPGDQEEGPLGEAPSTLVAVVGVGGQPICSSKEDGARPRPPSSRAPPAASR